MKNKLKLEKKKRIKVVKKKRDQIGSESNKEEDSVKFIQLYLLMFILYILL